MLNLRKQLPGLLLCLGIALPAWLLGKSFPLLGAPVIAILSGMLLRAFVPAVKNTLGTFESGVKFSSKKLLQAAIILLGFDMNLYHVVRVGKQSLYVMLFTLTAAFIVAYLVGRALKITKNTTILIGVGTSICGGSAIAATAPVIQAEDDEVAHAISTIFLFNILAVFIFPAMGRMLGLSDLGFGMWAGTAVNDTSSVVAAAASWGSVAGNDTALTFATIVKLTRTLMIVPITLVLALISAHQNQKNVKNQGQSFQFLKVFPWFVLGFLAAALINTFVLDVPKEAVTLGKFLIVMAMSAIGLNTHLKKLISNGYKPILLGLSCWIAVASVSLLVQSLLKLL